MRSSRRKSEKGNDEKDVYEFDEVDENNPGKKKKKRKILKMTKLRAKRGGNEANLIHNMEKKVLINTHLKHKKTLTTCEKQDLIDMDAKPKENKKPKKVTKILPEKKVLRSALRDKNINEPVKDGILKKTQLNVQEQKGFLKAQLNNIQENVMQKPSSTPVRVSYSSTPVHVSYSSTPSQNNSFIPVLFDKVTPNKTVVHRFALSPASLNCSPISAPPLPSPACSPIPPASPLQASFNESSVNPNVSCSTPVKFHNDESYSYIDPKGFDVDNCFGFDGPETSLPQLSPVRNKEVRRIKLVEQPKTNQATAKEVIKKLRFELNEPDTDMNVETDEEKEESTTEVSRIPDDVSMSSDESSYPKLVFDPSNMTEENESTLRLPRRSYERPLRSKRKKVLICDALEDEYDLSSEEEEEKVKPKTNKKGKAYGKVKEKKKDPAMEKWIQEFNKHCQEVENFGLCVE